MDNSNFNPSTPTGDADGSQTIENQGRWAEVTNLSEECDKKAMQAIAVCDLIGIIEPGHIIQDVTLNSATWLLKDLLEEIATNVGVMRQLALAGGNHAQ